MNHSKIILSLVGGIIKSDDITLKNHALGLFHAVIKDGSNKKSVIIPEVTPVIFDAVVDRTVANEPKTFAVHEPAPVVIPVAEPMAIESEDAGEVTSDAAPAETLYRALDAYEEIKAGDEWILNDTYHHNRGGVKMWREVGDSIGRFPSNYPKSSFRRKV